VMYEPEDSKAAYRDKLPTPKDPGPAGGTLPRSEPLNVRGLLELTNQRMRQLQDEVWEVERHLDPVDLTTFDSERWTRLENLVLRQQETLLRRMDSELTEQNRKIEALERTVDSLKWAQSPS
jgi:predicted RNase H-like nuclease (RuvC/YqgF family)